MDVMCLIKLDCVDQKIAVYTVTSTNSRLLPISSLDN